MTRLREAGRRALGWEPPRWMCWAVPMAMAVVRLLIAYSQRVYIAEGASGLDDTLMVNAAEAIVRGEWLGEYTALTIAKNMGFALWLALLHMLGVPFLVGNAALWCAASAFAVWCLRGLLRGQVPCWLCFGALVFQPVGFAFFNMRLYRDAVFPAFCLLFFAGLVGVALRIGAKGLRGPLLCGLGAGLGLAGAWLTREDGPVLLPFALCALALLLMFLAVRRDVPRRLGKALCAVVPGVVCLAGVLLFCLVNWRSYGVFLLNDLSYGSFPKAYGAVVAVSEGESGWQRGVPVTKAALARLYEEVPAFGKLRPALEGEAFNGFGSYETGEYGGSFYFALKRAAEFEGLTPDATAAQRFWDDLRGEVELAVAEGRLQSAAPRSGTVPGWQGALARPLLAESGASLAEVVLFRDCDPRPAFSTGRQERIDEIADFTHSRVQVGYAAGSDRPYHNPLQSLCFALCFVLLWLYRIAIWPLLALGLYRSFAALGRGLGVLFRRGRFAPLLLLGLLNIGLLLSALLRVGVTAYMEVAAFGIGTYIMYLSSAVPPLLLFCALGAALTKTTREALATWPDC